MTRHDLAERKDMKWITTPVSYTHLDVYKRQVLDIPEDLIFRSELKMKHDSMATLMNATRNDLG